MCFRIRGESVHNKNKGKRTQHLWKWKPQNKRDQRYSNSPRLKIWKFTGGSLLWSCMEWWRNIADLKTSAQKWLQWRDRLRVRLELFKIGVTTFLLSLFSTSRLQVNGTQNQGGSFPLDWLAYMSVIHRYTQSCALLIFEAFINLFNLTYHRTNSHRLTFIIS